MFLAESQLRLDANWVDFVIVGLYFAFVLGIGIMARRAVSSSLDFFLSGRSLPAWVTGLAFISANLGAVEITGMSANGADYGYPTFHYFWIGAVPATYPRLAGTIVSAARVVTTCGDHRQAYSRAACGGCPAAMPARVKSTATAGSCTSTLTTTSTHAARRRVDERSSSAKAAR